MGYSLINRFRGVLLGAAIGELVGFHYHGRRQAGLTLSDLAIDQWGSQFVLTDTPHQTWGRWTTQIAHRLIQPPVGQLEPEHLLLELDMKRPEGAAIALLPLLLYHHDRPSELASYLEPLQRLAQPSTEQPISSWNTLAVLSYAIGFILNQSPNLKHLLPSLRESLQLGERSPELEQGCIQVEKWIRDRQGLAVAHALGSSPYASVQKLVSGQDCPPQEGAVSSDGRAALIALYGFLSTPEDFRLSLLRTARLNCDPQITCTLVGALSGAYNGMGGIPAMSLKQLDRQLGSLPERTPLRIFWNLDSTTTLIEMADQLFHLWAGVYDPRIAPSTLTSIAPLS